MRELLRKRDFLIKVNKPPRCHNPFSHCPLFAANSSGKSYFNSLAFLVYTLSKPNLLYCCTSAVSSTRSKSQIFSISSVRNVPERRKVLGLKAKQSQDQRRRRLMNFIRIEGKISPKVTCAQVQYWIYLVRRGPLPRLVLRSMLWSRLRAKKSPSNLIKCNRSMLGMFVLS